MRANETKEQFICCMLQIFSFLKPVRHNALCIYLDVLHFSMKCVDFHPIQMVDIDVLYMVCGCICVCVGANFTREGSTVTMKPLCKWSKHFPSCRDKWFRFGFLFFSWLEYIGNNKKMPTHTHTHEHILTSIGSMQTK